MYKEYDGSVIKEYSENWGGYTPQVSVVTAVYNRRALLPRCMASVNWQTFRDIEYIIVNDGSEESLDDIVEDFMQRVDFPVLYIKKPNGGVHTARNAGVREARGRFFFNLDSDDEILPEALERMLAAWQEIPEERRHEFREVVARCMDEKGRPVGADFPDDINSLPWPQGMDVCNATHGEHVGLMLTQPLKDNPWPEPDGITFVTESIVWERLEKYKSWFINDMLRIYHQDNLEGYCRSQEPVSVQQVQNMLWNLAYMLNRPEVYRRNYIVRLKMVAQCATFASVLQQHKVQPIGQIDRIMDMVMAILLRPAAYFVGKRYIKRKMKTKG